MKLKYAMLLLVVPLTTLPLLLFWLAPHASLLQNRIEDSGERYILLARNLGAALERYHRDVKSVFGYVAAQLRAGKGFETAVILDNLDIRHVCLFDSATGELLAQAQVGEAPCPARPPAERWLLLQSLAAADGIQMSTVQPGPEGQNLIFMVEARDGTLAAAAITLRYIRNLGRQIAFGIRGHAAIVDQAGNALSHPIEQWQDERRNLIALPIVQRMLSGQSGVDQFHSPALNTDMVAGYTSVAGAGWGVMVPQPIDELRAEARSIQHYALSILMIGLLAAIVIAWAVAFAVARPLERLSRAAGELAAGGWPRLAIPRWIPREFQDMVIAFNKMVDRLHASVTHVNQLAYFDQVTGLANRAFFTRRALQYLEDAAIREQGGHILFVDLNGFKAINDRLGHQAGDVLLAGVGARLMQLFELPLASEVCCSDPLKALPTAPPAPLAARLGGDEFAVLVPFTHGRPSADAVARHVMDVFQAPFMVDDEPVTLGASIGIACYPQHGARLSELLKKADLAMYQAKKRGKNQVAVFADRRRKPRSKPARMQ